eukprot:Gb_07749 [translate_table: standard]
MEKITGTMSIRLILMAMFMIRGTIDFEGGKLCCRAASVSSGKCNFTAIFNFGDCNSDTGGLVAGLGLDLRLPNGQTFFHKSSGRYCDGRLVIDFLCEALHLPFLSSYLESVASNFGHGANFACAGSTVTSALNAFTVNPFSLNVQVDQFKRFKARVLDMVYRDSAFAGFLPGPDSFEKALYTLDMGQNDISHAFSLNLTEDQVIAYIPQIIRNLTSEVERLYEEGGRNFLVHNTGPLGCLPRTLAYIRSDLSEVDEHGCAAAYNRAAQTFNSQLQNVCKQLRKQLSNATIVYVDIYTIKYHLIANASEYGFEHPLTACCGYGGMPYNFNDKVRCSQRGTVNGTVVTAEACKDAAKYVSWDGIHFSETANVHISSQILSAKYSEPALPPSHACRLCSSLASSSAR